MTLPRSLGVLKGHNSPHNQTWPTGLLWHWQLLCFTESSHFLVCNYNVHSSSDPFVFSTSVGHNMQLPLSVSCPPLTNPHLCSLCVSSLQQHISLSLLYNTTLTPGELDCPGSTSGLCWVLHNAQQDEESWNIGMWSFFHMGPGWEPLQSFNAQKTEMLSREPVMLSRESYCGSQRGILKEPFTWGSQHWNGNWMNHDTQFRNCDDIMQEK